MKLLILWDRRRSPRTISRSRWLVILDSSSFGRAEKTSPPEEASLVVEVLPAEAMVAACARYDRRFTGRDDLEKACKEADKRIDEAMSACYVCPWDRGRKR